MIRPSKKKSLTYLPPALSLAGRAYPALSGASLQPLTPDLIWVPEKTALTWLPAAAAVPHCWCWFDTHMAL